MTHKKVGIYVDGDSLFRAAWQLGPRYNLDNAKPDYEAVMNEACVAAGTLLGVDDVDVAKATVYSVGRHSSRRFQSALEKVGFTVKIHILRDQKAPGGSCRSCGAQSDRFSWRAEIAATAMRDAALRDVEVVVLVVGSPEFVWLAEQLTKDGVDVICLGFAGKTSERLPRVRFLSDRCLYGDPRSDK